MAKAIIESVPTIEPVKHGKWLRTSGKTEEGIYYEISHCSVCGGEATAGVCFYDNETEYCPNCGSKMDGGEE